MGDSQDAPAPPQPAQHHMMGYHPHYQPMQPQQSPHMTYMPGPPPPMFHAAQQPQLYHHHPHSPYMPGPMPPQQPQQQQHYAPMPPPPQQQQHMAPPPAGPMPPPPSPQQQHQQHQQQQQQQQQLGGGPPSGRPQRKAGAQHSPAPSPAPTRASRSSRSSTSSSGSGSSPPLTATSPQTASSPPPLSTPQLKLDPAAKRAGKKKIAIEFIDDKSKRNITFSKRKRGIMKKAYELSTLTGAQVLLLVASETGHVYTFATDKLQPIITQENGKQMIQRCLDATNNDYADDQDEAEYSGGEEDDGGAWQ